MQAHTLTPQSDSDLPRGRPSTVVQILHARLKVRPIGAWRRLFHVANQAASLASTHSLNQSVSQAVIQPGSLALDSNESSTKEQQPKLI